MSNFFPLILLAFYNIIRTSILDFSNEILINYEFLFLHDFEFTQQQSLIPLSGLATWDKLCHNVLS